MSTIDDVTDVSPRIQYVAAAAQTAFDYPFPIFADGDLKVYVDGVLQALTTDYTVSGATEDDGGTVTFVSALDGNEVVTIFRDTAIERTTDYAQNGPLTSAAINDDFDKLFIIAQELEQRVGRALRLPQTSEAVAADAELDPANYASKYLAFDADGLPTPALLSSATMTQATIGALLYPRTAAEISAGVTPTNYAERPGWLARYGTNTTPGTTDLTTAVANCIAVSATHRAVFPAETVVTGKFTIPAGGSVYLPPGCVLKDSGVLGASDRLVNITNDNVHIEGWGAKVQMDRADYTTGEQRHGVYIYGAHDVTIEGLESSDSGGDGFYIGGAAGDPATDVTLFMCKGDNNRRQGLSVVNARRFRDIDGEWTNTTGTAPSAGIDIEPNATTDVLEDIVIVRPRCTGNDGPGIEIFLAAWNSVSNYCDITIVRPYTADNGNVSVGGRYRPGIDINRIPSTTPCRGRIRIIDPQCVDETVAGIHVYNWDVNGPLVEIIRPAVINPNQIQGSTSSIHGGIILYNDTTYTTTPGNVRIESPLVRDDDGFINAGSLNPFRVTGAWTNVEITNPRYAYAGTHPWLIDATASVTIRNDSEVRFDTSNGQTMTDWRFLGRTITNNGATGTITHALPAAVVGAVLDFALMESQAVRIDPNGSEQIVPTGSAGGKYIEASARGARVRLRCREAGFWDMEMVTGTWTSEP